MESLGRMDAMVLGFLPGREGRRDGNDNVQTLEQCVLCTRACLNTLHRCPPLILFFLIVFLLRPFHRWGHGDTWLPPVRSSHPSFVKTRIASTSLSLHFLLFLAVCLSHSPRTDHRFCPCRDWACLVRIEPLVPGVQLVWSTGPVNVFE